MEAFEAIAETRIRAAAAAGVFDDLPGAGRPLDLERHAATPPELRASFALLEASGFLPEELVLRGRVDSLRELLRAALADDEELRLSAELDRARLALELAIERRRPGFRASGGLGRSAYAARAAARLSRR